MLNLKEGPEISAEEREQILKMVAESEPEVFIQCVVLMH